jgi:agmatinase
MTEYAPPADAGLFACDFDPDQQDIIIIGVPWEPTVSYGRGTSQTPEKIVPVSHQLDFFVPCLGQNLDRQIGMVPLNPHWVAWNQEAIALAEPLIAAGGRTDGGLESNLARIHELSEMLNRALSQEVQRWHAKGKSVGILGGDHSSPFGAIAATLERYPDLGILHIDAHHDLRVAYEGFVFSHASIMYNVLERLPMKGPLVSVGIRDFSEEESELAAKDPRIHTFYDRDLARAGFSGKRWGELVEEILKPLPEKVYVSFDIDGCDPKLCPNTGTPVPGGIDFQQALFLLEAVVDSGRQVVGFDLCEVAPNHTNPDDEWDLNVGARVLHALATAAYRSKNNSF